MEKNREISRDLLMVAFGALCMGIVVVFVIITIPADTTQNWLIGYQEGYNWCIEKFNISTRSLG